MNTQHLLLLSLVTCSACSDAGVDGSAGSFSLPENTSLSEANQLLLGQWEWLKSVSNSTGPTIEYTPQSVGYTRQLRFSENGSSDFYYNDSLIGTTEFRVDSGSYTSFFTLVLDGTPYYSFRVTTDYFSFDNRPLDGAAGLFTRRE